MGELLKALPRLGTPSPSLAPCGSTARAPSKGGRGPVASPAPVICHRGSWGCFGWLWDTWQGFAAPSLRNQRQSHRSRSWCGNRELKGWKSLSPPLQETVFKYKNFLFQLHFYPAEASPAAWGCQHKHQTCGAALGASAAAPVTAMPD